MTIVLTAESSVSLTSVAELLGGEFFQRRFACISTAAAVYEDCPWVTSEQGGLRNLGAKIVDVELSTLSKPEALRLLEDSEGIFVHGGNTFFLLQEMQRVGFKEFVRAYTASNRPYVGSSAGAIVAGPRIDVIASTDEPGKADSVDAACGLDLVNFVPFVHFDVASYAPAFRVAFDEVLRLGLTMIPLRNDQYVVSNPSGLRIVTAGLEL